MTVNPDEVVGDRRRAPGRRAQGRGRGRAAARRHAAVARPGDARRRDDEGDRAQHDDPGPPDRDVLHRRGQPDRGRHRGAAGRAGARRRQPASSARFRLEGIRPAPRGVPQIEVTFDIDANGILNVSARDKDTGAEQRVTITESTNLDQSEIERMVADAEQHPARTAALREEIDARNELDSLAYQVERVLQRAQRLAAREREGAGREAGRRRPPGAQGAGPARPGAPPDARAAADLPDPAAPPTGTRPGARARAAPPGTTT